MGAGVGIVVVRRNFNTLLNSTTLLHVFISFGLKYITYFDIYIKFTRQRTTDRTQARGNNFAATEAR
jgi:hypothetical protein